MNAVSITKYRVINVANENRAVVAGWMNHHDPHHQSKMNRWGAGEDLLLQLLRLIFL